MDSNPAGISVPSLRAQASHITIRDDLHDAEKPVLDHDTTDSDLPRTYSASRQNLTRTNSAQSIQSHSSTHAQNRRKTNETRPYHDDTTELSTLGGLRPRQWNSDLSRIPQGFYRRLLGLNPFKTSYFSLFRPLRDLESRLILVCGVVCAIAAGVPLPIIGVIFGHLINSFPPPEAALLTSIKELVGVACAYFIVTWGWSVCWGIVGERVSRGLREALVEKAIGMDLAYFDVEDPDITSILTGDTQTIQMGTSEKVGLFIQSISYFVAAFVVGFILNAKLTGVLFAGVIPSMLIVVTLGTKSVSKLSKRVTQMSEKAAAVAEGAINAVQVVQAFGAVQVLSDDHYRIISSAARTGFKKSLSGALMLGTVFFVAYSADALAFFYGSKLATNGAGTVYAVVFLILDASFVVGQFGPFIQTLALAASAGEKVLEILDRPEGHINVYSEDGKRVTTDDFRQDLIFEDVTFTYPARPTVRVVDQISLRFKSGSTTGVVGASGSGKSTVASMLMRLYDPTSGKVMLGGDDLKSLHIASFRSQIALVDQDPILFTGTVLQNISHGIQDKFNLSEEDIHRRCTQAAIDANADFIRRLENGIHTKIGGNGGTQLSGGQRQRICLARALVRNPACLILDEPTSALDATSEALILKALDKVSKSGCTVIMIAHRLATIKDADNIVVMGQGHYLEEGTHAELIEKAGAYKKLVDAQRLESSGGSDSSNSSETTLTPGNEHDDKEQDSLSMTYEKPTIGQDSEGEDERISLIGVGEIMKRCFAINRPELAFIIIGVFASIISGAIIIGEAIIFGHLVTTLNTGNQSSTYQSDVNFYCLMFFVVALVALFSYSVSGTMFGYVSERLVTRIRDKSLRTILVQDISWFALPGHSPHELMAKLNMDSGHLSGLSGIIIGTICSVLTSITGGLVLALVVSWKIAIVVVATVPVVIFAGFMRLRILSKFEERHETAYNAAAALASESCRAIRTVAAFGREGDVLTEYRAAVEKPYRQSLRFIVLANLVLSFSYSCTYFIYALSYYWGAKQVRNGDYTQLQFFIVLPALLFSAQSSGQMFSLAPEVTRARSAANSVFALHAEEPTIMVAEEKGSPKIDTALTPVTITSNATTKGAVTFDSVSLAYPARPNQLVLHSVSLTVQPGQFIGLVGPSGAGKSTIISLLERFYDPTSGAVLIDGTDIRNIPVRQYRQRLSLVSQEPDLFPGSVSFNVGLGAKVGTTVEQAQIEEVCKQCGIHDFVMSLPEGYSTECGTNGSKLSGGQKQRVAIARALLRDPEILLMDEPTASLDSHSEREVQRAVARAMQGRTTIVVAHRLSSVQHADRIFVFDQGRIVEQGTHNELVDNGGVYAGMVKAQQIC